MTLEQLRTFLWVARLGGIRRAAQQMNISQPAVSNRIALLEADLGTQLLDRSRKGVMLTKQGVMLRTHAEQILQSVERIRAEVVPPENMTALLRLGVAETIVQSWLPEFLGRLRATHPRVTIEISVDISRNLREHLFDRTLDLALLMGPVSDYSVENVELPEFAMAWFRPVALEKPDLTRVPVISYHRQTRPYLELRTQLQDRYGNGIQMFSSSSLSAGFEMVAAGLGVGVFPRVLGERMQPGRIREFDPGWMPRPLSFSASYIGHPRDALAARAAQMAREVALEHAAETGAAT